MIERNIKDKLLELAGYYPVVTITGPRQAGKTTLCVNAFPDKSHVSLESLDTREYAKTDPRGFLAEYQNGAIFDEVQHAPDLLSYLQSDVDRSPDPGRFILTGSQHFGLLQDVSQSLAGRTGVLSLFPPTLDELCRFPRPPDELFDTLCTGAYPRIHDRNIPPHRWLTDYVTTYVQRDVRQVLNVGDLEAFTTFMRLCAGRCGQELNLSMLGGDAGVSHNTARSWLSVLEAGYICFRLPAWHRSVRKQMIKAPKLHFFDSGLLCNLLGIHEPTQLIHHPLRGAIFESWAVSEIYKSRAHRGLGPGMYHARHAKGLEVDLVIESSGAITLVEAKSGATVSGDFFRSLNRLGARVREDPKTPGKVEQWLVYGGAAGQQRSDTTVVSWLEIQKHAW